MTAYYNEHDPYAAQWLRNLIAAGHIAVGDVDERSIVDVRADDLRSYTQCHFFAGIGGWSLALRLAGWPDDRPVWTGSCPCQPFSAAGAGKAADDERHLWPAWFPLIAERRPAIVFGEQVEAAVGWGWLDAVFADLEGEGYACGAAVLPACGVGAPHIRQRLWFVADADDARQCSGGRTIRDQWDHARRCGKPRLLADADGRDASAEGLQRGGEQRQQPQDGGAVQLGDADEPRQPIRVWHAGNDGAAPSAAGRQAAVQTSIDGGVEYASGIRREWREAAGGGHVNDGQAPEWQQDQHGAGLASPHWGAAAWLPCTDGKARPVEPGTFPLAHGIPGRVGRLRAYGNAIVPQVAAEFIAAAIDG